MDDDTHWQSSVQALCSPFDEVYFSEAYETKNTEFEMPFGYPVPQLPHALNNDGPNHDYSKDYLTNLSF